MELAVALNLALETVKQVAFEFGYLAATQACHMNVIALWPALVEVLLALHVHEVELVYEPEALQQVERPIDSDAVNSRVQLARMAKDLGSVEMLLSILYDTEYGAALMREPKSA